MDIDLLSPERFVGGQPHDQFRWLREHDPVHWHAEPGGPGFWAVTQQVKRQVDRYRHLTLPAAGRMDKALTEHGAVVEAIAARDPDRAVAELRHHLTDLQLGIADVRRSYPQYFTE